LSLLFWVLLSIVQRLRGGVLRKVGCVAFLTVSIVGLDVARVRGLHLYGDSFVKLLGKSGALLVAAGFGVALLYLVAMKDHVLTRGIRFVLLFLLPMVPINLAGTAWAIHTTWPASRFAGKPSLPLLPPTTAPRL